MVRILFLCTGNSCRSQMAEAWARSMAKAELEVASAGTHPAPEVNPRAVRAMAEAGIDMAGQTPKQIADLDGRFDTVITVCANAAADCPAPPPGTQVVHWDLPDPADADGDEYEVMAVFRASRDEIEGRVRAFLAERGLHEV